MKKYMAPELEALTFGADEAIANDWTNLGSGIFNNGEFGNW